MSKNEIFHPEVRTKKPKLKNCPFCGDKVFMDFDEGEGMYIVIHRKLECIAFMSFPSIDELEESWNSRVAEREALGKINHE